MEEIEFQAPVYYVGRFYSDEKENAQVSDFTVWLRLDNHDIDITKTLTVEELAAFKNDFIKRKAEEKSYYESQQKDN